MSSLFCGSARSKRPSWREQLLSQPDDDEAWRFVPYERWAESFEGERAGGETGGVGGQLGKSALRLLLEQTVFKRMHEAMTESLIMSVLEMASKVATPAEKELLSVDAEKVLNSLNGVLLTYRFELGPHRRQLKDVRELAVKRLLATLFAALDAAKAVGGVGATTHEEAGQVGVGVMGAGMDDENNEQKNGVGGDHGDYENGSCGSRDRKALDQGTTSPHGDEAMLEVLQEITDSVVRGFLDQKERVRGAMLQRGGKLPSLPPGLRHLEDTQGYRSIATVFMYGQTFVLAKLDAIWELLPSILDRTNNYIFSLYNIRGKLQSLNQNLQNKGGVEAKDMLLDEIQAAYDALYREASLYVHAALKIFANFVGSTYEPPEEHTSISDGAIAAALQDMLGVDSMARNGGATHRLGTRTEDPAASDGTGNAAKQSNVTGDEHSISSRGSTTDSSMLSSDDDEGDT